MVTWFTESHPHGCVNWNTYIIYNLLLWLVASSRVRELKQNIKQYLEVTMSRILTGAWIETPVSCTDSYISSSRILTGAWIETIKILILFAYYVSHPHGCVNWNKKTIRKIPFISCRILTGAWIETLPDTQSLIPHMSHPHGCVNWNIVTKIRLYIKTMSHPHGCVNWNCNAEVIAAHNKGRILTGAWIETVYGVSPYITTFVASSRVRELKLV